MNQSTTPYDDVYRTMLQECRSLLIPVINEVFGTAYDWNERIDCEENEIFIAGEEGSQKRITDASFSIQDGIKRRYYHLECQSTTDGSMILRMYEYDAQLALKHGDIENHILTVRFPESAVLFLRHTRNTPDVMKIKIETPGDSVMYDIPIIKVQEYSIEEIFRKNLLFLIPFHLFSYEKSLPDIAQDEKKLVQLQQEYIRIARNLDEMCTDGVINEYILRSICQMTNVVAENLAAAYQTVQKGVVSIMGGKVLDYPEKTIFHKGKAEGRMEGRAEGIVEGRAEAIKECISLLIESGIDTDTIADKLQKKFNLSDAEIDKYTK